MPARQDLLLGQLAVQKGYLTEEELADCVRQQEASGPDRALGTLLVEQGYLSDSQLKALLAQQQANFQKAQAAPDPATQEDATFGKLILQSKLVTQAQLNECLRLQATDPSHPRLGEVLAKKGYLRPEQVQGVLASQNKVVVECPGCHTAFNIAGATPGQNVKCRACGRVMQVRTVQGRLDVIETVVVPPKQPGQRFGRFDLFGELGRGSMAVVYKGRDSKTGRAVALKVLARGSKITEVDIDRFRREAESAGALKHPNIVAAIEVGTEGGQHWISMDLVAGKSLDAMLENGPLAPQKAAAITRDIARALAHAHQNGIVHRDVKPGNILVDGAGKGYLTDFGLARTLNKRTLRLSGTGSAVGTPLYMSPEQAVGDQRQVDGRSDVYSLGAVLYEMLSGQPPISGDSVQQILDAVVRRAPRPLPKGVPAGLASVVQLAMQKEKELRYDGADALADDLDRFLAGKRVQAAAPSGMKRLLVHAKRNLAVTCIVGATLLLLAVLGGVLAVQGRASDKAADDRRLQEEADKKKEEEGLAAAAKDVDRQYHQLLADARARIAEKKWDAARDALQSARLKKGATEKADYVEEQLLTAEILYGKRDPACEGILNGLLESDPRNADAHWLYARMWLASAHPHKAMEDLNAVIAGKPTLVEALLARARLRDEDGDIAGAKADGEAALAADASNPAARLYRAKGRRLAGEMTGAAEDVATYLAAFPNDAAGYVERGLQHAAVVEMREALADLATALDKDPSSRVALLAQARLRAAMGDLKPAEHDFSQAIALNSDDPAAHVDRGEVHRLAGDGAGAKADYDEALRLRKGYALAHVGLGRLAEADGNLDGAEQEYTAALQADATCAAAFYHRGRVQARRGNDAAALRDLVGACSNSEAVREVFALTGVVYGGRFATDLLRHELSSPFQSALRRDDQLPPASAWIPMLAGDWEGSLKELNALCAGNPEASSLLGRGIVHMERREYAEAAKDLNDAVQRDARLAYAHVFLARVYFLQGQKDLAALSLRRARDLKPRSPLVLDTLGLLQVAQRDVPGAQASFAGVIFADPLWAEPRVLHGATRWLDHGVYSDKGWEAAGPDFEEAVALEWRSPEALVARGALKLNSGRKQEALVDAEAAMKLRPDDPIFQFLYGQALLETGKQMEGLSVLMKAQQLFAQGGSPTFLGRFLTPLADVALGEARLQFGQIDEAEKAYKRAEEGYFAESEAEFGLAKVCLAKKDFDRAWEYLRRSKKNSGEMVGKRDWDTVVKALEAASGKRAADELNR